MILQYFILNALLTTIATAAVVDQEPPVFTYCPNDIMQDGITVEIRVNWQQPTVTDNSGVPPTVTSNRRSGDLFAIPGSYEVIYKATDAAGNEAICSFKITLKRKTCPLYPAPTNGVLACFFENGEPLCAVMCQSRLDFVRNPPYLYFCSNAQWLFYGIPGLPYDPQLPWPDCSGQVEPSSAFKTASSFTKNHFFDGNASDPIVRDTIRTQFIDLLKAPYVPPPFCLFNPQCTKENVKLCVGASTDQEPPVFTYCPNDIMQDGITVEIRVDWPQPTVTDNSGVPPTVTSNRQSGDLFGVPGSYEVIYKATDVAGNEATCSFKITLKHETCPLYPAPKNGVLACVDNNKFCAVMCESRLDFVLNPPLLYFCSNAQWQFYSILPYDQQLPWPDCSGQVEPTSAFKAASSFTKDHFFDGNASDPIVQDTIRTQFIDFLKAPYVPPPFCLFNPQCTKENVQLDVGASTV